MAKVKKALSSRVKNKIEVWKEILPSIGVGDLYRLICRLKRHAKIFACRRENGKISLIVGYPSVRHRVNSRVIISSWVGKRSYESHRLKNFHGGRELKRFSLK